MKKTTKKQKTEIDMFFTIQKQAMEFFIKNSEFTGKTFNKRTKFKTRMKYVDALKALESLRVLFASQGSFSLGTCAECADYRAQNDFGMCKVTTIKHKYESCLKFRPKEDDGCPF